jgi:mRNA-degrading endonuclease RelE of RelBE toxin-antitoxin system
LAFLIEYSPDAVEHLQALDTGEQKSVLDAVDDQLRHQPAVETRNRKPMRPNPIAPWELRIRHLRVYYEVSEAERIVRVLAVGVKDRNVVRIGGEVIEL